MLANDGKTHTFFISVRASNIFIMKSYMKYTIMTAYTRHHTKWPCSKNHVQAKDEHNDKKTMKDFTMFLLHGDTVNISIKEYILPNKNVW